MRQGLVVIKVDKLYSVVNLTLEIVKKLKNWTILKYSPSISPINRLVCN